MPGAFDLEEDGVGVVGKQDTGDQTEHLRNNKQSTGSKDASVNAEENCYTLTREEISFSRQLNLTLNPDNSGFLCHFQVNY